VLFRTALLYWKVDQKAPTVQDWPARGKTRKCEEFRLQTPRAPPVPVAATLSPILWRLNNPDRFDVYSAGVMLLQMAFPPLRSDNALVQSPPPLIMSTAHSKLSWKSSCIKSPPFLATPQVVCQEMLSSTPNTSTGCSDPQATVPSATGAKPMFFGKCNSKEGGLDEHFGWLVNLEALPRASTPPFPISPCNPISISKVSFDHLKLATT